MSGKNKAANGMSRIKRKRQKKKARIFSGKIITKPRILKGSSTRKAKALKGKTNSSNMWVPPFLLVRIRTRLQPGSKNLKKYSISAPHPEAGPWSERESKFPENRPSRGAAAPGLRGVAFGHPVATCPCTPFEDVKFRLHRPRVCLVR